MTTPTDADREQWMVESVLTDSTRHRHGMCPGCRSIDRRVQKSGGAMPALALCLICAYVKKPGLFDQGTRAAVCFDCRDKAQAR